MGRARMKRLNLSPFGIIAYVVLTIWAILALTPLVWMLSTSFKEISIAIKLPPAFLPIWHSARPSHPSPIGKETWVENYTFEPKVTNFKSLFVRAPIARWFLNSAVVSGTHTVAMLLFCSMAGYAFAKKEFPGKNGIFWMLLSTMMIPGVVLLAPLFLLVGRYMGLMNTYSGLILPGLVGAFGIFLMKQFIQTLPTELIEAARIDGASEVGVFSSVILPLSKPPLAVLGIFSFMGAWNDFLWPLLITQSKTMRPLAVGLATLQQEAGTDYGLLMAGSVMAAIPMIIIFFALQRYFIKGLTIGAVKG
jgi:multiple sugar transport system permease protein